MRFEPLLCRCCSWLIHAVAIPYHCRALRCHCGTLLCNSLPLLFLALPCRFNALTRFSLTPRCARSFAAAFRSLHSHSLPLLLIASTAPLLCAVALSFRAMPSLGSSVPCLCRACPCHAVATPCPALLRNSDPFLLASVLCNSLAPPRRSLQFRCCSGISCHFRSLSLPGQSLLCHSSALRDLSVPFRCLAWLCLSIPQLHRAVRFRRLPCPFFAVAMQTHLILAMPLRFLLCLCNAFATLNYSMPSRF